jgi:hypothetical protein
MYGTHWLEDGYQLMSFKGNLRVRVLKKGKCQSKGKKKERQEEKFKGIGKIYAKRDKIMAKWVYIVTSVT